MLMQIFGGDKQRALLYVTVFLEWSIHGDHDLCHHLEFGDESLNQWNLCQMEYVLHIMVDFERFW